MHVDLSFLRSGSSVGVCVLDENRRRTAAAVVWWSQCMAAWEISGARNNQLRVAAPNNGLVNPPSLQAKNTHMVNSLGSCRKPLLRRKLALEKASLAVMSIRFPDDGSGTK